MLSMGVNGKMGIHASQVVWVEGGKAFVIGWDCSCQHVPASGWILGSGFCRPFSFLWKHTQSKICFRFPEDLKIQPKWASSRKFCALITNLQLLFFFFFNDNLYFSENINAFFFNPKPNLVKAL